MSCEEMNEWEEVVEEVKEVVKENTEAPSVEEVVEEIHIESHKLIDLQKLLSGKPNLKKKEMGELLKQAAGRVLKKYGRKACRFSSPILGISKNKQMARR